MFFLSRRPFGPRAAGQKGFSLIELLLVLGVIALLLVAAFVVYPKVRLANQANTEVKNLTTVQAGLKALYASKNNNFSGLTLDLARDAKIFPSTMVVGNTVVNSWGGMSCWVLRPIPTAGLPAGALMSSVTGRCRPMRAWP